MLPCSREELATDPVLVREAGKRRLEEAVYNDTAFLTSLGVMDYSLLCGVDRGNGELVVGIIDYVRQYTWVRVVFFFLFFLCESLLVVVAVASRSNRIPCAVYSFVYWLRGPYERTEVATQLACFLFLIDIIYAIMYRV